MSLSEAVSGDARVRMLLVCVCCAVDPLQHHTGHGCRQSHEDDGGGTSQCAAHVLCTDWHRVEGLGRHGETRVRGWEKSASQRQSVHSSRAVSVFGQDLNSCQECIAKCPNAHVQT